MNYNRFDTENKFPICEMCWNEFPLTRGDPCILKEANGGIRLKEKLPHFCKSEGCFNYIVPKIPQNDRYNFGCISTRDDRVPYTIDGINSIVNFANNWFNKDKYSEYFWWIETGKNEEKPNLHLHFIWKKAKYLNTKNHKRSLVTFWNATVGTKFVNKDDYYSEPFTSKYIDDKLIYAINSSKDLHENFRDLINHPPEGALRAWGGCKSLTAKYRDLCSVAESMSEYIKV